MHLKSIAIHADRFPNRRYFPFSLPVFQTPQELSLRRPLTLFVGENGSGKTTLLDAVAHRCGVPVWDKPRRHQAHANPFETELKRYLTVTWANGSVPGSLFRAETFREFADFLDDVALCDPGRLEYQGGRILNTVSHGQGFLSYFAGRFQRRGLYLLDEPEAALSPASQLRLVELLQRLEAEGQTQFIIATHSPFLLAYPGAQILSFDSTQIEEVTCDETAHLRIYRHFFASALQPAGQGELRRDPRVSLQASSLPS
jgi:predicted ATPase